MSEPFKPGARPEVLILGLGNTILSDDGVGIYVARLIGQRLSKKQVAVAEASLGGLELLDIIAGFRKVVIVDAMALPEGEPGSVEIVNADDLEGGSSMARHQVPFAEALELARQLKMELPDEIIIYGIQVQDTTTFGERCTPEVDAAIPVIAEMVISKELKGQVLKQT